MNWGPMGSQEPPAKKDQKANQARMEPQEKENPDPKEPQANQGRKDPKEFQEFPPLMVRLVLVDLQDPRETEERQEAKDPLVLQDQMRRRALMLNIALALVEVGGP